LALATNRRERDMAIVGIIIFGLIVGALARLIMPGKQNMGLILTCLLGIAGSLVGFFIFHELLNWGDSNKFDLGGIVGAVIGAMLLLWAYDRLAGGGSRRVAA
jgi:uncharacterized membrane protein YeaQ/YmgE (transglycosylase-associated protein family)